MVVGGGPHCRKFYVVWRQERSCPFVLLRPRALVLFGSLWDPSALCGFLVGPRPSERAQPVPTLATTSARRAPRRPHADRMPGLTPGPRHSAFATSRDYVQIEPRTVGATDRPCHLFACSIGLAARARTADWRQAKAWCGDKRNVGSGVLAGARTAASFTLGKFGSRHRLLFNKECEAAGPSSH